MPLNDLEHDQLPELGVVGQEQHCDPALGQSAQQVRAHHHEVAWEPVGEDAAEEHEQKLRHPDRRQDEAEVGLRPGQVEHGERKRDRRHRRPQQGDELTREEKPKLAFGERPERPGLYAARFSQ